MRETAGSGAEQQRYTAVHALPAAEMEEGAETEEGAEMEAAEAEAAEAAEAEAAEAEAAEAAAEAAVVAAKVVAVVAVVAAAAKEEAAEVAEAQAQALHVIAGTPGALLGTPGDVVGTSGAVVGTSGAHTASSASSAAASPRERRANLDESPHISTANLDESPHISTAINGDAFGTGDGAAHLPSSNLEPFSRMVADLDVSPRRDLNLCSAFAHVLADTMRTLTVMTCALLVSFGGVDALTADAVGSLVVSAIIALVAAYVLYEACVQALALRTGQPSHTDDDDGGALSGSRSGGGSSSGRQAQSRRWNVDAVRRNSN